MCDSTEKHNAQTCECTNVVFIFLGLPNFSKTILKRILLLLHYAFFSSSGIHKLGCSQYPISLLQIRVKNEYMPELEKKVT